MKRLFAVLFSLFLVIAPVLAQEAVVRFYIVPIEQVGIYRGPEYLPWRFDQSPVTELAGVRWSMKDYGLVNQAVVAAEVDATQHAFLEAQADVWAWAENLDTSLGAADRNALGDFLEAVAIPADWLSPQDTNRTALRTVTGMFLFMQRLTAITGQSPIDQGLALNTQFRNLPRVTEIETTTVLAVSGDNNEILSISRADTVPVGTPVVDDGSDINLTIDQGFSWQDAIRQAADDLEYDRTWLTDNMTLRQVLQNMADEWGDRPILFGFATL